MNKTDLELVLSELYEKQKRKHISAKRSEPYITNVAYQRELGSIVEDKVYFEHILGSETARTKFLTRGSKQRMRENPFNYILFQVILDYFAKKSQNVKSIATEGLSYLVDEYFVHLKLNCWPKLMRVTDTQLSHVRKQDGMFEREKIQAYKRAMDVIWEAYISTQYRTAAYIAALVLQQLDASKSAKRHCSKRRIEADLYHVIGLCLDGMGRHKAALSFFQMDARVAEYANIPLAKKRALDNVGRMYAQLGRYNEALVCWSERLKTDVDGEELVWLLYQISLAYTMLNSLKEASHHCRTCIQVAKSVENLNWIISGHLLFATISALQAVQERKDEQYLPSCLMALEEAYKCALRSNRVALINAVMQIIRTVYQIISTNEDDDLLESCWSTSLLDLLRQDPSQCTQNNLKILREILLQSGQKKSVATLQDPNTHKL